MGNRVCGVCGSQNIENLCGLHQGMSELYQCKDCKDVFVTHNSVERYHAKKKQKEETKRRKETFVGEPPKKTWLQMLGLKK